MQYNFIKTPNDTTMIEIELESPQDKPLKKLELQMAIVFLDENKQIKDFEFIPNNKSQSLQSNLTQDYIIAANVDGKKEYYFNFACCIISEKDAKKLADNSPLDNAIQALESLRGERFVSHPLYYRDYAKALVRKYQEGLEILSKVKEK